MNKINSRKKYSSYDDEYSNGIAVVGMSGRFPEARTIDEFWSNISKGVCSIRFFNKKELIDFGVNENHFNHPNYINAGCIIEDQDKFDEKFFGYLPLEASVLDPQHRIFLEIVHEALENAGYTSGKYEGSIAVFAGTSESSYFKKYIYPNQDLIKLFGLWESKVATSQDLLANRVSYKLNLNGPSLNINTACSTSLVNVSVACENLEHYKCDIAIAGGIYLPLPCELGYIYREGSILSSDGHCRVFDEDANGTVPGVGAGVVVLKRLKDALAARDNILAVIKGYAINNDGSDKAGFTAPSVEGQRKCIIKALEKANILPSTISYIEAHGTGTQLGDSLELQALEKVFNTGDFREKSCALGSVKSNIGHGDAAAGIIGLIKVIMCLKNKKLVPHIGCQSFLLDKKLNSSPFFINKKLMPWQRGESNAPLRAGVSSFGVGGTNAHLIVEEADHLLENSSKPLSKNHLLICSAKTTGALSNMKHNILNYMKQQVSIEKISETEFADFIYTLQVGREDYPLRLAVPCQNFKDAIKSLENNYQEPNANKLPISKTQGIVFMFPGYVTTQSKDTLNKIYKKEPYFKYIVSSCCKELYKNCSIDIQSILFTDIKTKKNSRMNNQIQYSRLSLFIIEYSLAKLLIHLGIVPTAMIGYSLGEYVAACLSEVITLSDALKLIFWQEQIVELKEKRPMMEVPLSQRDIIPFLNNQTSLIAVNSPSMCVISGTNEGISQFKAKLSSQLELRKQKCKLLDTHHIFHPFIMDEDIKKLKEILKGIEFKDPVLPYISNVTGTWITKKETDNKDYWTDHLCKTIKFSNGVRNIKDSGTYTYLEVGPGSALSALVNLHNVNSNLIISMVPEYYNKKGKQQYNLDNILSDLWIQGAYVNWSNLYARENRRRIPLPTYPFEKKKHWLSENTDQNSNLPTEYSFRESNNCITKQLMGFGEGSSATYNQETHSDIEDELVEIWKSIFGVNSIGILDSFFELGGHSLTAIQLISIIREKFIIEMPIKCIFDNPDIINLAKCIKTIKEEAKQNLLPPVIITNLEHAPVSFIQEQFWFSEKVAKNKGLYNLSTMFLLKGELNLESLRYSFDELMKRHTVLNSAIELIDDEIVQVVRKNLDYSSIIEYFDLSILSKDRQEKEIIRLNNVEHTKPFDFSKGHLIRAQLICLNLEEHILTISVHHAACDGWSLNILFKELSELYNAYKSNRDPCLPALPVQYADFALWQKNSLPKEIIEQQLIYWEKQLKGIPKLIKLPIDKPRPQQQTYKGSIFNFSLDNETLNEIKDLIEKHHCTFFMTIVSAFVTLLYGYGKQEIIVIGTPIANRHYKNVENLIGCFLNMLSLRVNCNDDPTFIELLKQVQKVTTEAYENRDVPYRQIINHLQIERSLAWNPIFQVAIYIQTTNASLLQFDGIEIQVNPQLQGIYDPTSKFDLTLWLYEEKEKLSLAFEYADELFELSTIMQMANSLKILLKNIATNMNQPISKFISDFKVINEKI